MWKFVHFFNIKFLSLCDAWTVMFQNGLVNPFSFITVKDNAIKCVLPVITDQ